MTDIPPYPGATRWAKVFGAIAAFLLLLVAVLMLHRGGGHGH